MKTTIDIADGLLRQAKQLASRKNTTLKVVVEQALRDALVRERSEARPVVIKTHTFGGQGLQPGLTWGDWNTLRDLSYEGRGT